MDDVELVVRDAESVAVLKVGIPFEIPVGECPQLLIARVQEHGRVKAFGELRGKTRVVVVGMRQEDREERPLAHELFNGVDVVRSVDHDAVLVIADDPNVVGDVECLAVEGKCALGDGMVDSEVHGEVLFR